MISEIFEQLNFLRDECLENYKARSNSFTEESVESMYNDTKNIITELIPVRLSRELSKRVITSHMDPNYSMEWQQIVVWLFQLTNMDDSFVYAYNYIAQVFNRENGFDLYTLKNISENDLKLLIENDNSYKAGHHQIVNNKRESSLKASNDPKTLNDIWQEGKSESKQEIYNAAIQLLKKVDPKIGNSFVSEVNKKFIWNESIYGNRQYLAAFIHVMIKKGWIKDLYSAPDYKRILENTFEFKRGFNAEPFKSLSSRVFDDMYIKPFENFRANI